MQNIQNKVPGGYEPQVQLANGKVVGLVDYVKSLAVVATGRRVLALNSQYSPVASYTFSAANEAWQSSNPGAPGIRSLYVPTLEELGLDPAFFQLEALAVVEASDSTETGDPLDIRVLDLSDNSVVPGSLGTATLSGSAQDTLINSAGFFPIEGGKNYFVDTRKRNVNETFVINLGRFRLIIRATPK